MQGYFDPQGVALLASGVERWPAKKLAEPAERLSGVRWIGIESHYFTALFLVPSGGAPAELRPKSVTAAGAETAMLLPIAAVDASADAPVELFVGAKDYSALARLGVVGRHMFRSFVRSTLTKSSARKASRRRRLLPRRPCSDQKNEKQMLVADSTPSGGRPHHKDWRSPHQSSASASIAASRRFSHWRPLLAFRLAVAAWRLMKSCRS